MHQKKGYWAAPRPTKKKENPKKQKILLWVVCIWPVCDFWGSGARMQSMRRGALGHRLHPLNCSR